MSVRPIIAITMGDPCGVGAEIIVKALSATKPFPDFLPVVIGDKNTLSRALKLCGSVLIIKEITEVEEVTLLPPGTIALLSVSALENDDIKYGRPTVAAGDAAYHYICKAAELALVKRISAMVTAPINKAAMNRAGHDYPGHTELLAELCRCRKYVMMLAGDVLRVSLVSIHEALKDVPALVTLEQVLDTIRVTAAGLQRLTGKPDPRLAVLSLNPHCGEGGMFGDEERVAIEPAIKIALQDGINVEGPLSADTLFYFAQQGKYDGVVAMYHDQGLIALKMLHFDDAVNITLGLPIIRTSVDHGTAYDLAGSGKASEKSLLAAIKMAVKLAA